MDIDNIDFTCDCGSSQYTLEEFSLELNKEVTHKLTCGDCDRTYHLKIKIIKIED